MADGTAQAGTKLTASGQAARLTREAEMISTKHGSGAGRALRRGAPAFLAAATLIGAVACSSSSSSSSAAGAAATSAAATGSSSSGAATAASAAGLSAYLPGKKATGTPVKVGLINNEGSSPQSEPSVGDAAEAAADYANAELGGIGGHPLQVIRCGENEDNASATACANEMVQDNVTVVVIGSTGFGSVMVPIITKAGIPYVSVTGSAAQELTTPGTYMWSGGYEATLTGFAKYAAQHGYKKVTAFVVNVPAAIAGAQQLGVPVFKAQGVGLTIEGVPSGVPDATAQVTAGLSGSPAAAIIIADEGTCTSVLKALNVVNPSLPAMGITSCLTTSATQALGNAMNGVKIFGASAPQGDDPEAKLYQYVMATWAPKANPTGYTVTGYQSMLGLIRATTGLTGAATPTSISAAIKAAKDVPLPAGAGLKFTCDGKALPSLPSVCSLGEVVVTVQNGVGTNAQVIQ
ncbi:MAG TPA: ABC transporter substrate-binding protein [Trebonia sp.]|nr:ABC transporter substrate-binding protein [Trebonia sp.]